MAARYNWRASRGETKAHKYAFEAFIAGMSEEERAEFEAKGAEYRAMSDEERAEARRLEAEKRDAIWRKLDESLNESLNKKGGA